MEMTSEMQVAVFESFVKNTSCEKRRGNVFWII